MSHVTCHKAGGSSSTGSTYCKHHTCHSRTWCACKNKTQQQKTLPVAGVLHTTPAATIVPLTTPQLARLFLRFQRRVDDLIIRRQTIPLLPEHDTNKKQMRAEAIRANNQQHSTQK